MGDDDHHDELIGHLKEEYQPILDQSSQAVYLYMDDDHKICNQKFATLLGYTTPEEWAQVIDPFTKFVAPDSQETLVTTYGKAIEQFEGSVIKVTWKSQAGQEIPTQVILVPISCEGHLFALHFVEEIIND